ncbi:hypothetical protein GOAMR_76_00640 [Gordonia amarae NBRC 15530]|uniref:Uncharacterized protein n=1 Tax=Gordonia amarae NBRC 15530 TaxID=1075090 RepID=G7GWL9_9ACTN|nr:hypothetical protein GOAMR_76_00640 [Gordonia amarae NBRC 15530]
MRHPPDRTTPRPARDFDSVAKQFTTLAFRAASHPAGRAGQREVQCRKTHVRKSKRHKSNRQR